MVTRQLVSRLRKRVIYVPGIPRDSTAVGKEMSIHAVPVKTLAGDPISLDQFAGKALLVVNVASKCGLTPQYEGLERLQKTYGERGFTVIGVPSNQFAGQ